ncbi:hypothetical protein, partial [Anaerotruncus colihominis]
DKMSDKEREILDVFKKLVPVLTDFEEEKLLAFGEGMVFKAAQQQKDSTSLADSIKKPPARAA